MLYEKEGGLAQGFSKGAAHESIGLQTGPVIFRLADVEIDLALGRVIRDGHEQPLRQQSFQVLVHLLERRGELVRKDELTQDLWHGTAVTDNALAQCIADIRRALGDDPRQPKFIKTIPRVGYRVIADLRALPEQSDLGERPAAAAGNIDAATHALPLVTYPAGDLRSPRRPDRKRMLLIAGGAALCLLLCIGIGAFLIQTPDALDLTIPRLPGKKPVAVMYLEDQSRKSELRWLHEGLADMFIADLAQSTRLTLLSRQQLRALLKRAGHSADSDIGLEQALDIARRSRAEAVLLGSYGSLGDQIFVNVQLYEAATGRVLAVDHLVVNGLSDLLGQIDVAAQKISAELGAPAGHGATPGVLAQAMTENLDAFRYYSLGVSKAQSFQNTEAIALLEKAIQLDPRFAMAYARLGYAYAVTDFQPGKGRPYLEKAIQLSDRLSEKDRLYVKAWYSIAIEDYYDAIVTLREIVAKYPLEVEAYSRLTRLLYREERPDEAILVVQQGLAVQPEEGDLYNVLGVCYLGLHRYSEAIASHQRYVQLLPRDPNSHDSLGMSFQQSGRLQEAAAQYDTALQLDPKFEPSVIHLGDLDAQQGRYRAAIREYRRYIALAQGDRPKAIGFGNLAEIYRRQRDFERGAQAARSEMNLWKGAVGESIMLALDRGDTTYAESLREQIFSDGHSQERGVRGEMRTKAFYEGVLALHSGQANQAIEHFEEALRHLPPISALDLHDDCLANAYLELGRLDEAIGEYRRILGINPNYPMAAYRLAQAYQRKGDRDSARAYFKAFLDKWIQADPDIPEVIDSRRALANLS